MKDTVFVYIWWNDDGVPVWNDMACPIIPAIATLRAVESILPIHVLDMSDGVTEWGRYPAKLGFEVYRWHQAWSTLPLVSSRIRKLCDRFTAVYQHAAMIPQTKLICCDSDIFWVQSPFPMDIMSVHGNRHNNGFFALNKLFDRYDEFMNDLMKTTLNSLLDREFRSEVMLSYYVPTFNDEAVWCYVLTKFPHLWEELPLSYNCVDVGQPDARNFHFCSQKWGNRRGLFAIAIKEFHKRLLEVLSPGDLGIIFGQEGRRYASTYSYDQIPRARIALSGKFKVY